MSPACTAWLGCWLRLLLPLLWAGTGRRLRLRHRRRQRAALVRRLAVLLHCCRDLGQLGPQAGLNLLLDVLQELRHCAGASRPCCTCAPCRIAACRQRCQGRSQGLRHAAKRCSGSRLPGSHERQLLLCRLQLSSLSLHALLQLPLRPLGRRLCGGRLGRLLLSGSQLGALLLHLLLQCLQLLCCGGQGCGCGCGLLLRLALRRRRLGFSAFHLLPQPLHLPCLLLLGRGRRSHSGGRLG